MPPVKVLHISLSKSIGGIAAFQKNLYSAMGRGSVEFSFVTTYPDAALKSYWTEQGAKVYLLPPQKTVFAYCAALYRLIRREGFDVAHIHKNSCANPMAFVVCKLAGVKKIIAHAHNTHAVGGAVANLVHYLFRPLVRKLAHVRLACAPEAGEWLFGKAYTATVVKNGIDTGCFAFDPQVRQAVREENRWQNRLVIGHVGNFFPAKNHVFMVDVIREAVKLDPKVLLVLVGQGADLPAVKACAKQAGVEEHIAFLGMRSDTHRLYQAMDVFLFPSLHEGLPIAGIEAQTAGLPCLFSDAITRDLAMGEGVVFKSLADSAASWAAQLLSMANTTAREKGRQAVLARGYDMGETAGFMEKLYKQ